MAKAQGSLAGMRKGLAATALAARGTTASLLTLAAPFAAIGAFVSLIRTAEKFNRAMAKSTAIMGELSGDTMQRLRQAALDVAKDTIFSATELAEAFFFLASAGLNAEQSIAALPLVARFAQAGMFDLGEATDLLTDVQTAFGLAVKDPIKNLENMTRVANALVGSNVLAQATTEQFSTAMVKAAPFARILGLSVEEAVATLAVFAGQGEKAERGGQKLLQMLRDLSFKALQNEEAFRALGVEVFDEAGEFLGTLEVVRSLEAALAGMSTEQKIAAIGSLGIQQRSIQATLALIGFSDTIQENIKRLSEMGDVVEDVAENNVTPLQEATAQLGSAWTDLSTKAGEEVIPALVSMTEAMAELLELMADKEVPKRFSEGFKFFFFLGEVSRGNLDAIKGLKDAWAELGAIGMEATRGVNPLLTQNAEVTDAAAKAAAEAAEKMKKLGAAAAEVKKNVAEAQKALDGLTTNLQDQLATFGMSALEAQLYKLSIKGLTGEQLKQVETIRAMQAELDRLQKEQQEMQQLQSEAELIFESTRTPLEQYNRQIEKLEELLRRSLIDQETFTRAVRAAKEELDRQLEAERQLEEKMPEKRLDASFKQISLRNVALSGVFRSGAEKRTDVILERIQKTAEEVLRKLGGPPLPVKMSWE